MDKKKKKAYQLYALLAVMKPMVSESVNARAQTRRKRDVQKRIDGQRLGSTMTLEERLASWAGEYKTLG